MSKGRMEAFSDGVFAIIITIMVLALVVPNEPTLEALRPLVPTLLSYVLSFAIVATYWNNHHHLLQTAEFVSGRVLWANMHLLFWLSLVPATTAWMGQTNFGKWPLALYGVNLLLAGFAFFLLTRELIAVNGQQSNVTNAYRNNLKERATLLTYVVAIPMAFVAPWLTGIIYSLIPIIWIIPDQRVERLFRNSNDQP